MPNPLPKYAAVKDNYLVAYFGHSNDYIVQLKYLRPHIEKQLPGIKLYIACRDSVAYLMEGEKNWCTQSQMKDRHRDFAFKRELKCNMEDHPVEALMAESNLEYPEPPELSVPTRKCVLWTKGVLPTKSLTEPQIQAVKSVFGDMNVEINGSIENAGWVVGVESEAVFSAASQGIMTSLIDTGIGHNLFCDMFPNAEVITL